MTRAFRAGDPDVLPRVAQRLRALGDPMRLRIVIALQSGERCVGDLVRETGSTQANVSEHLTVLRVARLVKPRRDGARVFHRIAEPTARGVYDAVCRTLEAQVEHERRLGRRHGS
ncbi:MAG TPA: metalloregulator ArsR/SmtB family transcription factor [Thermodesulfobacteriota bacterium]